MKATEIIRNLLDLIDSVETTESNPTVDYEDETSSSCGSDCDCPECQQTQLSNEPDELYVDTDTILSIGTDLHKPKHPSDIRADSVSMYPNMQYDPRK